MGKRFKTKPECGTLSGYDWHRRDQKAEPCSPCRDAMRSYWKQKRIERNSEINLLRKQWRMDEQYYRSMNNKRLHKNAKQEVYTYRQVLDTYGSDCHLCNTPVDLNAPRQCGKPGWELGLQVDHVIPLSKGGDDTLENVRPSHGYCNNQKSATLPM
jgi:5-methylcytosine-specific restriction endonuclease McrA